MNDEAHETGRHDHQGLGQLLESAEEKPGRERDQDGTDIGEGAPAQHERRACDRTSRGGGHPIDEGLYAWVVGEASEVRRRDDHEQVAREEHTYRGGRGTEWARDEVADERDRDDDWPRRDHRD